MKLSRQSEWVIFSTNGPAYAFGESASAAIAHYARRNSATIMAVFFVGLPDALNGPKKTRPDSRLGTLAKETQRELARFGETHTLNQLVAHAAALGIKTSKSSAAKFLERMRLEP